jgi:hypothetical protein
MASNQPKKTWAQMIQDGARATAEKKVADLEAQEKALTAQLAKLQLDKKQAAEEKAKLDAAPVPKGPFVPVPFTPKFEVIMSEPHVLMGFFDSAGRPVPDVPIAGHEVCTGRYDRPINTIDFGTVLNLTDLFFPKQGDDLFGFRYGGRNATIMDRVENIFDEHKDKVLSTKFFIAAINPKKPKHTKRDLPNVNAAVASWLLKHLPHDVEFIDPLNSVADPTVRVLNLSAIVRHIQQKLGYFIPIDETDNVETKALTFVRYQRGQGFSTPDEKAGVARSLGKQVSDLTWLDIRLTPGKYDYAGVNAGYPKICYKEYAPSVAHLVNQYMNFKEYMQLTGSSAIRRMYMVMDEFSGYSLATVAVLKGFGLDKITEVLVYHKGTYSSFRL